MPALPTRRCCDRPRSEFCLVASESNNLFDLCELHYLQPRLVDGCADCRVDWDPRDQLLDDLSRHDAAVTSGEVLKGRQGAGASEVTELCVIEGKHTHDRESNSRRSASRGSGRCSGRSTKEAVPQSNSTVRAADSLPAV